MKIAIERTGKNLPALWEEGGGRTNTGRSRIICGPAGEPLRPIYIRRRGERACAQHALFIIKSGYFVIDVSRWRDTVAVEVMRITSITTEGAETVREYIYSGGEWSDPEPPEFLHAAIGAACKKASCYHCREPHFAAVGFAELCCES